MRIAGRLSALIFSVLAMALAGSGCGYSKPGKPLALSASASELPASTSSHVVVIVMENDEYSAVIGNPQARFVNQLAHHYALASRYYAVTHPSLPNYLALTGGSTFGIQSDCTDCVLNAENLIDQLDNAQISWKAYMEGLPTPCDTTATAGGYAKKHDPFLYYQDIASNRSRCANAVPYEQLGVDLRSGHLPTFVWITPNLCDDGHDCSLGSVDHFLAGVVPALLRELGPHGVLALTWDEGTTNQGCCAGLASGGRVLTVLAGPDIHQGMSSATAYDHYSLLRTIEDLLRLKHLRQAGAKATAGLDSLFFHEPRIR